LTCKTRAAAFDPPEQRVVPLVEASVTAEDASDAGAPEIEITLSRGACYGYCPEYTVSIRSDGTITYQGKTYVGKHGRAQDNIPPADVAALVAKFDAANFETLRMPQTCHGGIGTDASTDIITFRRGEKTHTVEHYLGNPCAPEALTPLAKAVDDTAKTDRFVRCGKNHGQYCRKP